MCDTPLAVMFVQFVSGWAFGDSTCRLTTFLPAALQTDYIKSMGLAGSMVWSVETDDFRDRCGFGTKNPMMTAIWTNLNGEIPTPAPQPTTPAPTGPVSGYYPSPWYHRPGTQSTKEG